MIKLLSSGLAVAGLGSLLLQTASQAHEVVEFPDLEVVGRSTGLVGHAVSASQGFVGQVDIDQRPISRAGDLLETVPGMIATQHSGSGKANQYFLRGFNLDHGTDFATWVDGMPVNMVSHGHGQGYTDLNFLTPEFVDLLSYKKGGYHAEVGDFSTAGAALIRTKRTFDTGFAQATIGENGYLRGVVGDSVEVGSGDFLAGLEYNIDEGPWTIDEDLDKISGLLKYSQSLGHSEYSISFMGYDSSWNSADQIPLRAVQQGLIGPLGSIDDTVGGASSRYSLSANWLADGNSAQTSASAYAMYYDMALWSNFTYFLEDPENGDQFEQADQRMIYGGNLIRSHRDQQIFGKTSSYKYGVQLRYDDIDKVGLYNTVDRERIGTVREDSLGELAIGLFSDLQMQWTRKLRANFGLRGDYYRFDVTSSNPANSGEQDDFQLSPKLNLVYAVGEATELYASAGYSFHTNDARGTTISVDPTDPATPIDAVDPIVRSRGGELGARVDWNDRVHSSVALWELKLDSELLYVGDAGITEATQPSERYGIEFANYFQAAENLVLDADISFTDAAFKNVPTKENEIPGAIDTVVSAGATYTTDKGFFGTLRARYFGGRPLIEDGSVESASSMTLNTRIGFRTERWEASLDIFNLTDELDDDITYFYESRLRGEPAGGVADIHFHPIQPRQARLNFRYNF